MVAPEGLHEASSAAFVDESLHCVSNIFVERNLLTCDFTERRNSPFIIAFNERTRAPRELSCSFSRQNDQGKSVGNLFQAVFYSYTSHEYPADNLVLGIMSRLCLACPAVRDYLPPSGGVFRRYTNEDGNHDIGLGGA